MILFVLIACLVFFSFLILTVFINPMYHRKKWLQLQLIFDNLYATVDGIEISKKDRANLKLENDEFGYGEICFDSFSMMLAVIQPTATDVFYDLGSGTGKAVFCSAMLYELKKSCGIELLPGLYHASISQLEKFNLLSDVQDCFPKFPLPIHFIKDNFLEVDFLDATIVFINATCFAAEFWQQLINKLNMLQSGIRVIVVSKQLSLSNYQLLDAKMYWMSWGWSSVYIYKKM